MKKCIFAVIICLLIAGCTESERLHYNDLRIGMTFDEVKQQCESSSQSKLLPHRENASESAYKTRVYIGEAFGLIPGYRSRNVILTFDANGRLKEKEVEEVQTVVVEQP